MEENKLYKQECQAELKNCECIFPKCDCPMEEYTPPTPLELEQLEKDLPTKLFPFLSVDDSNRRQGVAKCLEFLKPLISSMLNEKQDVIDHQSRSILDRREQISSLQTQLQQKEERIKELESEKHTTNE
jgi:hypothetical protein